MLEAPETHTANRNPQDTAHRSAIPTQSPFIGYPSTLFPDRINACRRESPSNKPQRALGQFFKLGVLCQITPITLALLQS